MTCEWCFKTTQNGLNDLLMTIMRLMHLVGTHFDNKGDIWMSMCKYKSNY